MFKASSSSEMLRIPSAIISFIFFLITVSRAASGSKAFQIDNCNVTKTKHIQSAALCMLIFTLIIKGLEEFREKNKTLSATCLAEKWEAAQNTEFCHRCHKEETESIRNPVVPFGTDTFGFYI